MAAPITHIVLAEKVFNKRFKDKNKKDFFIGTCFPDIRYQTGIERNKTHFKGFSLEEIKRENSFMAGVKFHALTDVVGEKFVRSQDIYNQLSSCQYAVYCWKIIADEILYSKIDNWSEFISYLDKILSEELSFGLNKKEVLKWHKSLQKYLAVGPNRDGLDVLFGLRVDVNAVLKDAEAIRNDERVISIIKDFYNNFENILTMDD